MADTPPIAQSSAQRGFLPPGPGLYRFQFDTTGPVGFDEGYWEGPHPMEGTDLDNFMQQYVAGITGLPPTLMRPRWQDEPPDLPDFGTDWAAVGLVDVTPDPGFVAISHDGANDGRDTLGEHEIFTLLVSFYGPHADWYDRLLTTGCTLPQNHEIMQLNSMGLVDRGSRVIAPAQIKNRWTRRIDRRIRYHRQVQLMYPVLNILSAPFHVTAEGPGGGDHAVTTPADRSAVPAGKSLIVGTYRIFVDINGNLMIAAPDGTLVPLVLNT